MKTGGIERFRLYFSYLAMDKINPFHLAIPVYDLQECRNFYLNTLQCSEGRSSEKWVDLDLFGHQLVLHEVEGLSPKKESNPVDG